MLRGLNSPQRHRRNAIDAIATPPTHRYRDKYRSDDVEALRRDLDASLD